MSGAGNEARTRDLNLGKVALYQLSYSRGKEARIIGGDFLKLKTSNHPIGLCLRIWRHADKAPSTKA